MLQLVVVVAVAANVDVAVAANVDVAVATVDVATGCCYWLLLQYCSDCCFATTATTATTTGCSV